MRCNSSRVATRLLKVTRSLLQEVDSFIAKLWLQCWPTCAQRWLAAVASSGQSCSSRSRFVQEAAALGEDAPPSSGGKPRHAGWLVTSPLLPTAAVAKGSSGYIHKHSCSGLPTSPKGLTVLTVMVEDYEGTLHVSGTQHPVWRS